MTHPLPRELAQQAVDAVAKHGDRSAAARALNLPRQTLVNRLAAAARFGLNSGTPVAEGFEVVKQSATYDKAGTLIRQSVTTKREPGEEYAVPTGFAVAGESVLTDADGRVTQRWVKTTREAERGAALVDALQSAFSVVRAAPAIPAPPASEDDTLTVYPLPDLHFGMYAWGEETGADYDTDIATRIARQSVASLVAQSRPSRKAVILGLGDYFHANDQKNATPASGHRLDVDGRWQRVFAAGAALMVELVELVASKHELVEVALLPGNHDEDAAVTLRVALNLYFRNNPRVSVYMAPGLHWFHRFGRCLLGATHGHTMKPDRMALMLAADRAEDWGATEHRHVFFGHIHHETAKEVGPVRCESFGTLAARDAYSQSGGYRSSRSLTALTFHREAGEIGRHRVNILAPKRAKEVA